MTEATMDLEMFGAYDDFIVYRPLKKSVEGDPKAHHHICAALHELLPHPQLQKDGNYEELLKTLPFMQVTQPITETKNVANMESAANPLLTLIEGLVTLQQKEELKTVQKIGTFCCEGKILMIIETACPSVDVHVDQRAFDIQLTNYNFEKKWQRRFCRLKASSSCTYNCLDFQVKINCPGLLRYCRRPF